jgi:heat shock protein HslJ
MKQHILLMLIALILPVAGITSCASFNHLGGTSWRLVSCDDQRVLAGTEVSLDFNAGASQLNGRAGCNQYGGDCRVSGDNIRMSNLYQTEMACLNPGVMEQETLYLNLLEQAKLYEIRNADLYLYSSDGETLVFERVIKTTAPITSLAGTSWKLGSFIDLQAASSTLAGTTITLSFGAGNTMEGSAGCNTYSARCNTVGSKLSIFDLGQTKRLCQAPAGIMQQEAKYLELLGLSETFEANTAGLTIHCQGGQALIFAPA